MEQIEELIKKGSPVIDVRTMAEFWLGHAENTINIPLSKITEKVDELKQMTQPILLCCRSGARSGQATEYLRGQGIDCYNIGSWKDLN